MHLLHDPFIFVNAYTTKSKNKRALSKSYKDTNVMEFFGVKQAKTISNQIRRNKYKFAPAKRTRIPKQGKKKTRLVNVPTPSDQIVQEVIRGILEAIYEPVFREWGEKTKDLCNNYGYRPRLSTWSAMEKLERYSRKPTVVIKGDIVSAYNHVDNDILLDILKQRIKDKNFLYLIKKMFKSGVMDQKKYERYITETPQGGIVSLLLFNIYLLGFDQYVHENFIKPVLDKNEGKSSDVESKAYSKIKYKTSQALKKLKNIKSEKKLVTEIKKATKEFKRLRSIRINTSYVDTERLEKGAVFVRYADDWVLLLNCKKREAEVVKQKIADFLRTHRKMELDEEKTSITHVSDGYKFLGFEVRLNTLKTKLTRVLQRNSKGFYSRAFKRITSRQLTIEPDSKRILDRLKLLKFCNDDCEPRAKPSWIVYEEFQIVQKYAQVFRSIFNYYAPCEKLTRLSYVSYILQYSCARTLARRKKMSMKKLFSKYGKNMLIRTNIKEIKKEKQRTVRFLDLTTLRKKTETPLRYVKPPM